MDQLGEVLATRMASDRHRDVVQAAEDRRLLRVREAREPRRPEPQRAVTPRRGLQMWMAEHHLQLAFHRASPH